MCMYCIITSPNALTTGNGRSFVSLYSYFFNPTLNQGHEKHSSSHLRKVTVLLLAPLVRCKPGFIGTSYLSLVNIVIITGSCEGSDDFNYKVYLQIQCVIPALFHLNKYWVGAFNSLPDWPLLDDVNITRPQRAMQSESVLTKHQHLLLKSLSLSLRASVNMCQRKMKPGQLGKLKVKSPKCLEWRGDLQPRYCSSKGKTQ